MRDRFETHPGVVAAWRSGAVVASVALFLTFPLTSPLRAHDIADGTGCHPTQGDGDDHGHVYVTGGTANETDGTVTFHVICAPCAVFHATTHWHTADGTALAGQDYVAKTVGIQVGNSTADEDYPVVVDLINDSSFEPDETFSLVLTTGPGDPSVGPPCLTLDATSAAVTVHSEDPENTPPTVSATTDPVTVAEGSPAANSGTFSDAQGNGTVTVTASVGAVVKNDGAGTWSWSFTPADGPDQSQVVTITATDNLGASAADTFTLTVNNVAPHVVSPTVAPEPSDEGAAVTASADFTDPAGALDAPFTCTVDYGDASGALAGTVAGFHCAGPSHSFADDGTFSVKVCVTDQDGAKGCSSSDHVVHNLPPEVDPPVVSREPSAEGAAVTASADFTDAAGAADAPFTCTVDYGDLSGAQAGTVAGFHCTGPSHTYADNGSYGVEVCVTDKDGGEGCRTADHGVSNVAPEITGSTNSAEGCGDTGNGTPVEVTADFTDPGFDSAVAGTLEDFDLSTIDWGDGTVEPATVSETAGSAGTPTTGTLSGTHTYAAGGIYSVVVTVEDDDGGSDSVTLTALVSGAGLTPAGLLGVVGTDLKDVVNIQRKGAAIEVQGPFLGPGKVTFPVAGVLSIEVATCDGDDQIHVNQDVLAPAKLDGGAGDDHIRAGGGPTILLGGDGADHLFGGPANDQLQGGAGDDELNGGGGANVLDGGPQFDRCNTAQGTNAVVNCEG